MATAIEKKKPVIILGAGLSGSMMAVYLAQRGFNVEIYERRPDMRGVDISAGKSINLAISVRGLHAMEEIGVLDEVKKMCIPMRGRIIHDRDGATNFQPYSKDETTAINSISRGELNMLLMNTADEFDNIRFHFNHRCLGVDMDAGIVRLRNETTGEMVRAEGQTVISCDGAFSGGRGSILRTSRFNFSQEFHSHAYKELSFSPTAEGGWRVDKNALHIWPRGGYMLIALPNLDGSFTVTLFYPAKGPESFESLNTAEAVEAFFKDQFPDALDLMPDLATEFFENPTGDLVTIRCNPYHYADKMVLVGDAAHAIVPFYGQGMNAAFEDCTVLNECIDLADNWAGIFQAYADRRIQNGHAIADLAIKHYIEMRDSTGDPGWVFRKQIEHILERKYPSRYISEYEMVSFTRTPYA
ncbi:MAG: NAD(P)/FAD-dependent oxidoreductase, partial [Bacteroidota bacterium]